MTDPELPTPDTDDGAVDTTPKVPRPTNPRRVNGRTVQRVRSRMYLNVQEFAVAIGVHQSSVYRWEVQAAAARVRPTQAAIVAKLHDLSLDQLKALGDDVRRECAAGRQSHVMHIVLAATAPAS